MIQSIKQWLGIESQKHTGNCDTTHICLRDIDYREFFIKVKGWLNYKKGLEVVWVAADDMAKCHGGNKHTLGRSISPTPIKPGRIELRQDLIEKGPLMLWVFCHEIGHQLLHNFNYKQPLRDNALYYYAASEGQSLRECEADSVAYAVFSQFGFDFRGVQYYLTLDNKGQRDQFIGTAKRLLTQTRVKWAAQEIIDGYAYMMNLTNRG